MISLKGINGKYDFLFSNAKGNRIYARNVDRMFRAILKRCSIAPTGVHTLRHTFASCLFAKGVDVKTVSELLGHSDVGITIPVPNSNTKNHTVPTDKNNHNYSE